MKKELQDKLYTKYPLTLSTRYSCLEERGIECDDGWYDILDKLFSKIEPVLANKNQREIAETLTLHQIKEKFGELTIYSNTDNSTIKAALIEARQAAKNTCEECGQPGYIRNSGWMQVKCDRCVAKKFIQGILASIDVEKDIKEGKLFDWASSTRMMAVKDDKWYEKTVEHMLREFEPKKGKTIEEIVLEQQANFGPAEDLPSASDPQ